MFVVNIVRWKRTKLNPLCIYAGAHNKIFPEHLNKLISSFPLPFPHHCLELFRSRSLCRKLCLLLLLSNYYSGLKSDHGCVALKENRDKAAAYRH